MVVLAIFAVVAVEFYCLLSLFFMARLLGLLSFMPAAGTITDWAAYEAFLVFFT